MHSKSQMGQEARLSLICCCKMKKIYQIVVDSSGKPLFNFIPILPTYFHKKIFSALDLNIVALTKLCPVLWGIV